LRGGSSGSECVWLRDESAASGQALGKKRGKAAGCPGNMEGRNAYEEKKGQRSGGLIRISAQGNDGFSSGRKY